jgi:hypothetical protein
VARRKREKIMKWLIALTLCVLLAFGTAYAGPMSKVLTEKSPKAGAVFPTRDYSEGFESSTFPPTGWTQTINCVTDSLTTWGLDVNGLIPDAYEGLQAAYIHWQYGGCPGGQNEWIKFNYTLTNENTLSFATMGSTSWTGYADFVVTINGTQVWSFYNDFPGSSWVYEVIELDLSAYSGTIEIGFGYVGDNGADHYLDAINLYYEEPPQPPCCPFDYTCYLFDFNASSCGVRNVACGGATTWQWGVPVGIPMVACDGVPVTNVLGTTLAGAYPVNAGEKAVIGPVHLDQNCTCLELCHWYDFESDFTAWDGGNVKVSTDGGTTWTLIYPADLYPGVFSVCGGTYYPACVCGEQGFAFSSGGWVRDCFDISAFVGQDILIGFCFGSDSSVSELGWYIKWAKIGGKDISPVEDSSWGSIKALYR